MKFLPTLFAGLAAVAALTTPAHAAKAEVRIAVDYEDLDLRKAEDLAQLLRRVDAAAESACTHPEALTVAPVSYDRRCKASLVAAARQAITRKRTAMLALAD